MTTAEIVKGSKVSKFVLFREGHFHYRTDSGYDFTVPLDDIDKASMLAEDKTIYFMRWIRKQVESGKE